MALAPHSHSPLAALEDDLFFHHGLEPRFGLALLPNDFNTNRIVPRSGIYHLPTGYRRTWAMARQALQDSIQDQKSLHFEKDGLFQVCVDVHHFLPHEISVKTIENNVIIEGKHEERDDGHGSVMRHFVRKYSLPKDYDMSGVYSSLSSDGIVTIKAPPPNAIGGAERHVPIAHTNVPAHLSLKEK